ncbi:uncharacterized protein LOC144427340 [Styela clava]
MTKVHCVVFLFLASFHLLSIGDKILFELVTIMDDDNDDGDVYEVEKIVDNVVVGGTTYYRVRWKNYDEDGDTWEPRENLLSCEDLLNSYIRGQSEKTSGLTLPEDVFTAGTGDSETESEKSEKNKDKKVKTLNKEKKKQKQTRKKQVKEPRSVSSSDEEPQVKDPFWENLKEGKIDVFASDLYSKVKQRRPPSKEGEISHAEPVKDFSLKPKKRWKKKKPENDEFDSETDSKQQDSTQKNIISEQKDHQIDKNLSEDDKDSNHDEEPNMVLQYLEKEIKTTKGKKKEKNKIQDDEQKSNNSQLTEEKSATNRSFRNLFEESEAAAVNENVKTSSGKTGDIPSFVDTISKPNIVLEKLDLEKKNDKDIDTSVKKKKKNLEGADISNKNTEVGNDASLLQVEKKTKKIKDKATKNKNVIKEISKDLSENVKSGRDKKISKKDNNGNISSDLEMSYDSDKSDQKSRVGKDGKQGKNDRYQFGDAFSAQLQESDHAVSDLLIKKKTKKHKSHTPSPIRDRIASSSSLKPSFMTEKSPPPSTSGASVLEMLTKEMERTVTMGSSSIDPKLTSFEAAVKDAHSKLGLKPPSGSLISAEKEQQVKCAPDMIEFLKIKVNFELDEISVKDIEKHHEMGEPPCRLDREVNNAEFRQYIRSNNYEMVHEVLKIKKMYNLEHADSVWMTQLMVAADAGFDEIVKILAHHGAKVNTRSKNGQTALMFAAEKGHDIVCRILIAYGAYINLQTTTGDSALMKAAKMGHHTVVRHLLQEGADPSLKSPHGTTALELAERANHMTLGELIKEHEMNVSAHVNECIHRECHSLGIKTIGLPILSTRVYNIRETALVHVTFNCVLQNIPPNQGLLLFALHGMIGSGLSIKCRMRGPCHVNTVTLNHFVMDPMMPGKQASDEYNHFITHLIWRGGQNSLRLFLSQDALSNEKLFISIYLCAFTD